MTEWSDSTSGGKGAALIRPGSGEVRARGTGDAGFVVTAPEAGQSLFAKLRDGLKRIEVNGETLYVAEGDTLLSEPALKVYADERELRDRLREAMAAAGRIGMGAEPIAISHGLTIQLQMGRIVRWKPGTVLSYRVVRETFADAQQYDAIVAHMAQATRDWEATCGCDFRHVAELDGRPLADGAAGAVFTVRHFDADGAFLAAAFFPNDPRARWNVLVDPSFFRQTSFDPTGIFRHELGHVLGFRHEHIRKGAPPVCPDEPLSDVLDLTQYDPKSVMHYFCGRVGSTTLVISDLDRSGAQKIYGPPLGTLAFVHDDDL